MKNSNIIITIIRYITSLYPKPYTLNPIHGFTLVEILVSATIIGLLSTIGMSGFQAITRSGRDALRKSDLEQIRSALEIYKSEKYAYPPNSAPGSCIPDLSASGLNSNYIKYPSDPKSPTYTYCYVYRTPLTYSLCAHLENGSNTASSAFCDDSGGTFCTGNCNLQLSNP